MSWLRQLFSRQRLYRELSEEIRAHIDEKIEELVADEMSREDATQVAHREFGNVCLLEEKGREVWGVAIGVSAGFVLRPLMSSLFFGVTGHDPLTFAGVPVLLFLIALFACYIPDRRALLVHPVVALRYE